MKKATLPRLKVTLGNEIRMILPAESLAIVQSKIKETFDSKLPSGYKVYYLDHENDVILITTQEDYEAAVSQAAETLKLFVSDTSESIRESLIGKTSTTSLVKSDEEEFEFVPDINKPKHEPQQPKEDVKEPPKQELIEKFAEQIKFMIKQELLKVPETEIETRMSTLMLSTSAVGQPQPSFNTALSSDMNYSCHICKVCPIKSVVYKCLTCSEYYLCAVCEERFGHDHPLLKYRMKKEVKVPVPAPAPVPVPASVLEEFNDVYRAEYFDDNGTKLHRVIPNQQLTISWVVKNTGKTDWPSDTIFAATSGSLELVKICNIGAVKAGEYKRFETAIKTNKSAGKYTGFFHLVCSGYSKFGPRIKAMVSVITEDKPGLSKDLKNLLILSKLCVPKSMEENMLKLLDMCDGADPAVLFTMLKKSGNNVQEVANEIFSKSGVYQHK